MTTIQIQSKSLMFSDDPNNEKGRLFDVNSSTSSRFAFDPYGVDSYVFRNALPTNMSLADLRADLSVDGSLLGGGGLGAVRLVSESPARDGYEPGDSNRDYYFDQADFIQALKSAHQGRIEWGDGDWNGDGMFNASDFVGAFTSGNYGIGPYDDRAGESHHQLSVPITRHGRGGFDALLQRRDGDPDCSSGG